MFDQGYSYVVFLPQEGYLIRLLPPAQTLLKPQGPKESYTRYSYVMLSPIPPASYLRKT